MGFFRKKNNNPPPKRRIWDKLIMGAVIGGAIGSVLGASIAPKKGSETREQTKKGLKKIFSIITGIFKKRVYSTSAVPAPPLPAGRQAQANEDKVRGRTSGSRGPHEVSLKNELTKKIPHEHLIRETRLDFTKDHATRNDPTKNNP